MYSLAPRVSLSPPPRQELLSKITEYNMYKQSGLEKSNSVEKLKPKEVSLNKIRSSILLCTCS